MNRKQQSIGLGKHIRKLEKAKADGQNYSKNSVQPTAEQKAWVEDLFGPMAAELKFLGLPYDDFWWVVEQAEAAGLCVDDLTYGQVYEYIVEKQRKKIDDRIYALLPDPDTKVQLGYSSASDRERDEWIYNQVKAGVKNDDILKELNKIARKKKWNIFRSEEQISRVVKRYVTRTGATPLKPRKGGRPSR